jgi:hypothetical protein
MHGKNMLATGYALDKRGMFKAPDITGWHVYICGPKLIEELCRLPDDTLDIQAAAKIVREILLFLSGSNCLSLFLGRNNERPYKATIHSHPPFLAMDTILPLSEMTSPVPYLPFSPPSSTSSKSHLRITSLVLPPANGYQSKLSIL